MTSQLNVDTIVDKAGSGGSNVKMASASTYVSEGGNVSQNTVQSLMKTWVRYDHTVPSVTDSFNESSVTDINTGVWSLQFTNNMSNGNYGWNNGLQDGRVDGVNTGTVPASGTIRYYQRVANTLAVNDGHFTLASIHGDLA